ncbi:MAG TPA: phosphodiester glycosidase family protein [Gaiellaceae bacterium]|nr:phosphodiester glycosidase family protein [Gaiellaceae bacterium]
MFRRVATLLLLSAVLAGPAYAQGTELLPGVTFEQTVQFTPHGPVVLNVITAPRPGDQNGLYALVPVLGGATVTGGRERVTQIEKDVSSQATVAGVNGDFFSGSNGQPAGIFMRGGLLVRPPLASRSSVGVDAQGVLHVDRVKFFGTWRGTGQRRTLDGLNQVPTQGQVVLFTPDYGLRVPAVPGSAEVVLQPFPATAPNADLTATVSAVGAGGGERIPPGGAIIQATGPAAANLRAEAPAGTSITARLILQPAWTGLVSALGGGPELVRNSAPIFQSLEDFTNDQVAARSPRAAVGQLADGRIILVAVDGAQPGYSVGLTNFELAQAMARLGAVTASALGSGNDVTAAFDGQLLNRPSAGSGGRAVKEALLVEYFGVYASEVPFQLLTGEPGSTQQQLSYKIVRPSLVTAELIGPDNVPRVLEAGVQHGPGTYAFTYSNFDVEGTWHWNVTATDDLQRTSTIDRTFRYDATLRGLVAPNLARGIAVFGFTLARSAAVTLQIETKTGVVVRELAPVSLPPGAQSVVWDGTLPHGSLAYAGAYVAHLSVTSSVGTSGFDVPFAFRRS